MKIASWNVNSIRVRQDLVEDFLRARLPEILLLQEIKCEATAFPAERFAALGYQAAVVGQKAYNGVAVLSRLPVELKAEALPGRPDGDVSARYIEVQANGITIGNLYAPNGNSGGEVGFSFKLAWLAALAGRAERALAAEEELILAGDFNVCPEVADMAPGALSEGDALIRLESRSVFRRLLWAGMTDSLRALDPLGRVFTYWDYQGGAFDTDRGLRIDHILLTPSLAEHLTAAEVDRAGRAAPSPSDHAAVMVELAL